MLNYETLLIFVYFLILCDGQSTPNSCIRSCGGAKTWALAVGLSTTFYQQCVRGEENHRETS